MITNNTITSLIKTRTSCRTYNGKVVDPSKKAAMDKFADEPGSGPFGLKSRFKIIGADPTDPTILKGLKTYGVIKGASAYIVGAMPQAENNLEDFGYAMQQIILFATDLDLGTCWLGGTFNKSVFSEKMSLNNHETVPAVTALGHRASKQRLFEKFARYQSRADTRRPFQNIFFEQNFEKSLTPEDAGDYKIPLEMVRIGPSASNKQPWRMIRDQSGKFHLFLMRTKNYYGKYNKWFDLADLQRVDMGIAMCHFELTCRESGLKGKWIKEEPPAIPLPEFTEYVVTWEPL